MADSPSPVGCEMSAVAGAVEVNLMTKGVLLREKQAAMKALSASEELEITRDTRAPHATSIAIMPKLPRMDIDNVCR